MWENLVQAGSYIITTTSILWDTVTKSSLEAHSPAVPDPVQCFQNLMYSLELFHPKQIFVKNLFVSQNLK